MPSRDAQFDRKLAAIFQAEAAEHVRRMQECLAELGSADGGRPLEALFRATHSLKGAARAVGEDEVEVLCHATESLLAGVQRGRLAWSPAIGDALHEVVGALARALKQKGSGAAALATLLPRLERLERGDAAPAPQRAPAPPAEAVAAPGPAEPGGAASAEPGQTVRIGVDRLGRLLYQVEELVAARLGAERTAAQLREALASAEALRGALHGTEALQALQRHEALLRSVAADLQNEQRLLAGSVDALLGDIKQALLLPVGSARPYFVAAVRELARSQGKDVELRITGEDIEIDRRLLEDLREPLLHLLRNAIAHGIEPPAQRVSAGKPAAATLEVRIAARAGGQVEITVADDGAGIDTARLAQAARELHVLLPDDAGDADLLPLVFAPGVSTAARVTEVAGRGVGLAIVRETVERLGGTIEVRSTPGVGTMFTMLLTLSLATYRAVEVRASGRSFLLPTARVERCVRFAAAQVRAVGGHATVPYGEQDLPLVSLAGVLALPAGGTDGATLSCLVLGAGTRRIALAVDEVRGEQEVLGKPVDTTLVHSPVISGAAVLAAGEVAPILNVPELVRTALREGGRSPAGAVVAARARGRAVLLAEDSITSRTLLKNILELAGHRVETAVDGLEALQKLRGGGFDVVVSDVEMPRLDGFGLTEAIRRDSELAHLPVVLVTSLGSPADRERGAEAGANAYIVKSSFDQGNLLQAIAELA